MKNYIGENLIYGLIVLALCFCGWAYVTSSEVDPAYVSGQRARRAGATAESNPFGSWLQKEQRQSWLDGWIDTGLKESE